MITIAFWAQSLDNVSPDHMEIDGQILQPNHPDRKNLVSAISKISLNKKIEVKTKLVTINVYNSEFTVKTFPEIRDEANRRSPIMCYGVLPDKITDGWISNLIERLFQFAIKIDRSLEETIKHEVDIGFRKIQTRRDILKKTTLAAIVTLIFLLALVIGYEIFSFFIQRK